MTIPFTKRVSVPQNVMFRELEGESVILNIDSESYYGLDDVGTRMWEVLIQSESIQAAFETLIDEYDVQSDRLRDDLAELIEQLAEKALIEFNND